MKTSITVDAGPLPDGASAQVAADVHLPDRLAEEARLFYCVPGGGMTRVYFDMDGGSGTEFSFARAMTAAGHVVIAVDPVGVGDSTQPDDGFMLTAEVEAGLLHRAFLALRERTVEGVEVGGLPAIGCGHSAGGLLIVMQQALFRDFVAILPLCFGTAGLPQYFTPEQIAALSDPEHGRARITEAARQRFPGNGYFDLRPRDGDVPKARALRSAQTHTLAVIGLNAMTPGNVRPEVGAIDVPVFVGMGERDMTGLPHPQTADYRACPDLTLYVMPTSSHNVFVTDHAPALFGRVARWVGALS